MKSFLSDPGIARRPLRNDAASFQQMMGAVRDGAGHSRELARVAAGVEIDKNLSRPVAPGLGSSVFAPHHAGGGPLVASSVDDRVVDAPAGVGGGREADPREAVNDLIRDIYGLMRRFEPIDRLGDRQLAFGNVVMVQGSPVHIYTNIDQINLQIWSPRGTLFLTPTCPLETYGPGTYFYEFTRLVYMALGRRLSTPGHPLPLPPQTRFGLEPRKYEKTAPLYTKAAGLVAAMPAGQRLVNYGQFVGAVAQIIRVLRSGFSDLTGTEKEWDEVRRVLPYVSDDFEAFMSFFDANALDGDEFVIDLEQLFTTERPGEHGAQIFHDIWLDLERDPISGDIGFVVTITYNDSKILLKRLQVTEVLASHGFRVVFSEDDRRQATGDYEVPYQHHNLSPKVTVYEADLEPERFASAKQRYQELMQNSADLVLPRTMPLADFVQLVARLVKRVYPVSFDKVTGEERTWEELRAHGGLDGSSFDKMYSGQVIDGVRVIDFYDLATQPTTDHGTDPIRNSFRIVPILDGRTEKVKFLAYCPSNVSGDYFAVYETLVEAGIPITLAPEFTEHINGKALQLDRNDPRLVVAGILNPSSAVSRVLRPGEASPLGDLSIFD